MPVLFATAYFPPAGYMAEVVRADEIIIEAYETYTKQTSRNHCSIFGPNGRQTLSIPVIKANGNHTLTKDILVSDHQHWQKIHWRSIETAYNNSPFFLYYQDHFACFFEKEYKFLLDLNMEILHTLLQIFKRNPTVGFTEQFEKTSSSAMDLRTISTVKSQHPVVSFPYYTQVFASRHGFIQGLSILDILFNLGPESVSYLESAK